MNLRGTTESLFNNNELFTHARDTKLQIFIERQQANANTSKLSHTLNPLLHSFGSGNIGKHSALWFCIVPSFGRANTATIELSISQYCPLTHAIIHIGI